MRVTSSLADIEFDVGALRLEGGDLVVESGADSTIATTVRISRAEGRRLFWLLIANGVTWRFFASLLFGGKAAAAGASGDRWADRRRRIGLNKPW